jgi:hypothetical protein
MHFPVAEAAASLSLLQLRPRLSQVSKRDIDRSFVVGIAAIAVSMWMN